MYFCRLLLGRVFRLAVFQSLLGRIGFPYVGVDVNLRRLMAVLVQGDLDFISLVALHHFVLGVVRVIRVHRGDLIAQFFELAAIERFFLA
jgi:hypothetical protein